MVFAGRFVSVMVVVVFGRGLVSLVFVAIVLAVVLLVVVTRRRLTRVLRCTTLVVYLPTHITEESPLY